jgi:ABC-type multidrug transport system permease subunit
MKYAAFFPQDARSSELASAWGLIFLSILLSCSGFLGIDDAVLRMTQSIPFWVIICLIMGSLQLFSVALYPSVEILRAITAWVNGSMWLWIGFSSSYGHVAVSDAAAVCLGFSNLYAFSLNSLMIHKKWDD